jgi:transposase InsO family protein
MVALGIIDTPSPNTIAKYIPATRKPPSERTQQAWKTFIANHMDTTWAMDFCVVPTLTFHVLYVFIVISHARRKIVHIAVTKQPTMAWTAQQLREATPFGEQPKYLIRDNDSIYGKDVLDFIAAARIEGVRTAYRSPWQNPFVERLTGILRRELLDHIIPLDERHLERLLREFVEDYYHPIRTHSGLDCEPPLLDSSVNKPILLDSAELDSQPILGGLYHGYHAKAA